MVEDTITHLQQHLLEWAREIEQRLFTPSGESDTQADRSLRFAQTLENTVEVIHALQTLKGMMLVAPTDKSQSANEKLATLRKEIEQIKQTVKLSHSPHEQTRRTLSVHVLLMAEALNFARRMNPQDWQHRVKLAFYLCQLGWINEAREQLVQAQRQSTQPCEVKAYAFQLADSSKIQALFNYLVVHMTDES